jgi:protein-S-isoprenylcysteine O-methyltransferase Ste14
VQAVAGAVWWAAVFASEGVRWWTLGSWDPALLVVPDLVLFVGASALVAVGGSRAIAVVVAAWTSVLTGVLAVYGLAERAAGWGVVAMVLASVGTAVATATLWSDRLPLRWFFAGPFGFRVAAEGTGARHLRRSLAQLAAFWTAFDVLMPLVLATIEYRLRLSWPAPRGGSWDLAGATAFAAASVLGVWSCVALAVRGEGTPLPAETARNLVLLGPYQYVRNPMAVAGVLQVASIGLWCGSWMVVAAAVAGAVTWHIFVRPAEEADLLARFGAPYEAYRATVRCWVPTARPGGR